jgi:hypothetical protein
VDVLEGILERIAETTEQRDALLRQVEAEEQKIAKLEQMFNLLDDPTTQDLMKDLVVGVAVQNGAAVPNDNAAGERHYVGMQRVREYVGAIASGDRFTVHDVFQRSVEHMPPNPKMRHPEFEKQRKASISIALTSMAKAGDIEIVKQGRGRDCTVFRKPEARQ